LDKQESELLDELYETEGKIFESLYFLINSDWDSNTLKLRIMELMKQKDILETEQEKFCSCDKDKKD